MKNKRKKLSTTITAILVSVLAVLNVILTIILVTTTSSKLNAKQNSLILEKNQSAVNKSEQFLEKYVVISETLAKDGYIKESLSSANEEVPLYSTEAFSKAVLLMQDLKQSHSDILSIGIGSIAEDRIYSQDGVAYNITLSSHPYYETAKQKTFITEPYVDSITGELCVSIVSPTKSHNSTIGLLILDIKLSQMTSFMEQMSFAESGHSILISNDNLIISHFDFDKIGKNIADLGIEGKMLDEVKNPTGTLTFYELNGTSKICVVNKMDKFDWKVITMMEHKEYNSDIKKTTISIIVLLIIYSTITAAIVRTVIVKKLAPIAELNEDLKLMSEGNLQFETKHQGNDEIGEMADSMRSCVTTLSDYVGEIDSVMEKLAGGDLTVKPSMEFKGDFISIQKSTFAFVEKLTDLVHNISTASEQVSNGSEQVSSSAQALAQGATEQASSIEELVATISDLSNTISSNAEMAQSESEHVTVVHGEILESSNKMNQSLDLMEEIRSSANKVSGIVKTIEDIAFQTNILALNAAVEAARAGASGKGFAVVASEVRNLAAKSAEASKATTDLIGNMVSAIERGSVSMEETKVAMDNVVEQAMAITAVFQKISDASNQQAISISQVSIGTDQISSVISTNSATAEESAAASEELSSQSQILKGMISQFKLPTDEETDNNNNGKSSYMNKGYHKVDDSYFNADDNYSFSSCDKY